MKYFIVLVAILAGCGGGGSDDPAQIAPAPSQGALVSAYGDSTQAAQGNPHSASRPGVAIENHGISGSSTGQWLAVWQAEMAGTQSKIVVYNGGLNDGGLTLEQYKNALREMIRISRAHNKQFVMEQPNNAVDHAGFNLPAFNERRASVGPLAMSEGVYYCAQPDVPLRDGAHPTAEGYATKSDRLAWCLADLLKQQ